MTRLHGATSRRRGVAVALAIASGLVVAACSPTFDWREARPEGSAVTMLFPCRPGRVERTVRVAGLPVVMQLHSCNAGGAVFSLAVVDAGSADRVAPLLSALRGEAAVNVAAIAVFSPASAVAGSTSHPLAGRARIDGRLPDRRPVREDAVWFVGGTRVYQATVLGTGRAVDAPVLDAFFDGLRVR